MKKRFILSLLVLILCTISLLSCAKSSSSPTPELTLNVSEAYVVKGGYVTLTADLKNSFKSIVWTSDNTQVAVVESGRVYGIDTGLATITAAVGEVTAECKITVVLGSSEVTAHPVPILEFEIGTTAVWIDCEFKLNATLFFEGSVIDTADITFSSANSQIVEIINNDTLSAKAAGDTIITALCVYDNRIYSQSVSLTVVEELASIEFTAPFNVEYCSLKVGDLGVIAYSLISKGENITAAENTLVWYSSDVAVIEINQDGTYTCLSVGTAKITVAYKDSAETFVTIAVIE